MQEIYRVIARLMGTDLTVMIIGESGTGKELVARALHDYGKRRNGPFVAINMAAIPRELIESELFGHEKGAFTGATARGMGRFEQAKGGTLFLDEIGDMPLEAQTRLLRVLQEGEYTAVGGRVPIRADVRIIAATHRDLRSLIRQGLFREDLFYRLNVAPIRLPPLRERSADIPALVRHFAALAAREGLPPKQLDEEAMERLRSYRWPGNVRELENLIRRLAALYSQEVIGVSVIEAELGEAPDRRRADRCRTRRRARRRGRAPHPRLFRRAQGRPAGGRALRPGVARDRTAADRADPRRHPRQPDQGGPFARPQPQHAAQEDPRIGHPGGARPKISVGAARQRRRCRPVSAGCGRQRRQRRRAAWKFRRCALGIVHEADAAGSDVGRPNRSAAQARDRLGRGCIGLRGRDLSGADRSAALRHRPSTVLSLLNLDLVLLLVLGALVAKRVLQVWAERRRGLAGSRLQIRLVVLFSLIAVMPTIIVAVFSYLFFSYGVESWFSDKVRTAISNSLAVAEAYVHEHQQAIRADALAMANDLDRDAVELELDPNRLEQVVSAQAALRGLTEAVVFDRAGMCSRGRASPSRSAFSRFRMARCASPTKARSRS